MIKVCWFVSPAVARVAAAGCGGNPAFGVEASLTPSSDAQFDALLAGKVDAVVTSMDNVMAWNRRAGNLDACIIAQIETTTPLTLMARPGLTRFADLVGQRLLVDAPGNGFVVALQNALLAAGVSLGDCQWVEGGGVAERLAGLREGVADATLLGPPFDAMAQAEGFVAVSRLNNLYPTFPGQGLVVRRSVLAEKRAELAGWLQALEQARAWMTANGAAAAEFLVSEGVPAKVAQVLVQGAPNALVPDQAGVELLIKQRERLYPNDIEGVSYQTLVDNGLLLNVN